MERVEAQAEGSIAIDRFGGAPRFLPSVTQDVRQKIAHDSRIADDHTLFGRSGGGLFCTYALVTQPQAFKRYICGSAALSAGDYEVFRIEELYAQQHTDLGAIVFFGVGAKEVQISARLAYRTR